MPEKFLAEIDEENEFLQCRWMRTNFDMLADFLENQFKVQKEALIRSDLCMVALYSPNMGFPVGAK
jgi:hypothetical protein